MVQHYGSLGVQSRKTLKNAPGQLERPSWGSERAWAPEEEEEEEEEDGESGRSYVITYAPHFNFALLDPSEFHGLIQTFASYLSLQAEVDCRGDVSLRIKQLRRREQGWPVFA